LGILVGLALAPQLEAFGDMLCRVPEAVGKVALTFDDGPDPATTPRVLEALDAAQQKATFFVLGWKVAAHPELAAEIAARGHQLALHGYHHERLYSFKPPRAVAEDLTRCQDVIERAAGVRPIFFRPPIGQASPRTFAGARRAGVALVGWSLRPRDGLRGTTSDQVVDRITARLRAGDVVLLHDALELGSAVDAREPPALAALPRIFQVLRERKLRSVTLQELIEAADSAGRSATPPAAG
jgi:peptidoglycan/xylan/chitin deacetylase (PgdA/CDA1 family)